MATITEPTSKAEVSTQLNLSGSSGYTVSQPAPSKKQKATPALSALVATSENVQLHSAAQIAISSGSEVSVVSSAERQRRYDADLAKLDIAEKELQVAKARAAMMKSRDELSAVSRAGSVGRLDDVRSDSGVSLRTRRPTDSAACLT